MKQSQVSKYLSFIGEKGGKNRWRGIGAAARSVAARKAGIASGRARAKRK